MRPVLTPEEAGELDRETQARGVPAAELMERAGRAVARAAVDVAGGVYGRRAVVLCGRGNNGGDGFVAARHLARAGVRVDVITTSPAGESAGPAGVNAERLAETGLVARPWSRDAGRRLLGRADVAVDALFGIGFRGRAEGAALEAIEELNASPAPVCLGGPALGGSRGQRRGRRAGGVGGPHGGDRRRQGGLGPAAGRRALGHDPGGRHRVPRRPRAPGRRPRRGRRRRGRPARPRPLGPQAQHRRGARGRRLAGDDRRARLDRARRRAGRRRPRHGGHGLRRDRGRTVARGRGGVRAARADRRGHGRDRRARTRSRAGGGRGRGRPRPRTHEARADGRPRASAGAPVPGAPRAGRRRSQRVRGRRRGRARPRVRPGA